jgi:hypothetical protein
MSQTGYTPISLYYSSTTGHTPSSANLTNGELAINITDGLMFYKDGSGNVQTLASKSATSGTFSSATISGGTINGTTIGATTAATGAFTSLAASGTVTFTSTGAVQMPSGTTAQEPSGATAGMLRFNTSTTQFEGYNGTSWASVGGAAISNDTSTATAVYPLFAHATSGSATTVYTSNANYLYTPSTGQLQAPFYIASGTITGALSAGAYSYGTLGYSDVNIFGSFTSSVNTYNQIVLQNTNSGTAASSDYVVSNNLGTATTYYGDYGMNSSGWTGVAGTNSFNAPNMVYLTSTTADILIGTTTSNSVRIATNGGADAVTVTPAGVTNIVTPTATNGIFINSKTVSANTTIPSGSNGQSVGPITIASGVAVTVSSGSRWLVM